MRNIQIVAALNAVTTTTTSSKVYVGEYKKVGILMRRSNHGSGSSAFTFKGGFGLADSDPVMTALNTLIDNVTNTNVQGIARVNGKTLAADGDAFLWVSPETPITHIEATVTETTDGTHSCWIIGFC